MKTTFLAMLMLTALVDGGGGDAENANEPATTETTETLAETPAETPTPEAVAESEEVEETADAAEA